MNRGKKIKSARTGRGSFLWQTVDHFTAVIYSLFIFGRFGESLSNRDTYCRRSYLSSLLSRRNASRAASFSHGMSVAVSETFLFRLFSSLRDFVAQIKLHVYGTLFTFYGFTAALVYYISMLLEGQNVWNFENLGSVLTALTVTVCALPLLFSSQSATAAISKSRMMRKIVLDFLDIPEEKLKCTASYGGKEHILLAALLGMVSGILTYFLGSWYLPVAVLCIVVLFVIFTNPESGIILTVAAIPFLHYGGVLRYGLVAMILITSASYICKLLQRRRSLNLSPELTMVLLFCSFILAASIFTAGGAKVFSDALVYVIIIIGGFFLTYNLITSQKGIKICTRIMALTLVIYSLIGIGDAFYNGISHRLSDTMSQQISDMSKIDVTALFGGGWAFGIMAVLSFPLIFAFATKRKSAKGVAAMIIATVITLIACWMCSKYEVVVTLLIEFVVFWMLYSHKSLTVAIFLSIPMTVILLLYPYAISYWNWPDISGILIEYIPANYQSSAVNGESVKAVLAMIFDGNWMGIGAGEQAIRIALPAYSSTVSYAEVYSSSVWLQVLCWSGVFGTVSFLVFIGFLVKRSFRCFARSNNKDYQGIGIALFSSIMISLILGLVTNIWLNEGMMYIFWLSVGLLISHIRDAEAEREKRTAGFGTAFDEADAEVLFYK